MSVRDAPTTSSPSSGWLERLRARWRPGPWNRDATGITALTLSLLLLGLLMSFSAAIVADAQAGNPFGTFQRQLLWAAIGLPLFALAATLDHRIWRRLAWPLLAVSLAGLVLVLVPGVGAEVHGSTRWLRFGPLAVQPSEIAKLATLVWIADVLERKRRDDGAVLETAHLMVPALPLLGLLGVLVLAQPDLGTTIVLALIVGALLWIEGLPGRFLAVVVAAGAIATAALALLAPYRVARLRGWLWPEQYPLGEGYQLLQSRYALGSGGWFGLGIGSSRGKWNFIPNPETDFIFAIIGEELGLVGAAGVLLLFVLLLYLGLRVAYAAPDGFGRTVAFAVTTWLVGQALINVGTVTGLLPITGVPLPLVSVGGSSLLSTLVALGLLIAVARSAQVPTATRPGGTR